MVQLYMDLKLVAKDGTSTRSEKLTHQTGKVVKVEAIKKKKENRRRKSDEEKEFKIKRNEFKDFRNITLYRTPFLIY